MVTICAPTTDLEEVVADECSLLDLGVTLRRVAGREVTYVMIHVEFTRVGRVLYQVAVEGDVTRVVRPGCRHLAVVVRGRVALGQALSLAVLVHLRHAVVAPALERLHQHGDVVGVEPTAEVVHFARGGRGGDGEVEAVTLTDGRVLDTLVHALLVVVGLVVTAVAVRPLGPLPLHLVELDDGLAARRRRHDTAQVREVVRVVQEDPRAGRVGDERVDVEAGHVV